MQGCICLCGREALDSSREQELSLSALWGQSFPAFSGQSLSALWGQSFPAFSGQSLSAPSVCHRHSFHGRLVSRVLCARGRRDHLSVTAVADSLSATSEDSDGQPRVSSLLTAVLLPIGFTLTDFVSEAPVGSYPAFSPLHFCRCFLLHFP